MAGQFRSSQWDPVLIIAQIVAMQCVFYVGLGTCVAIVDFVLGYNRSLSHLFVYQVNCSRHRLLNISFLLYTLKTCQLKFICTKKVCYC